MTKIEALTSIAQTVIRNRLASAPKLELTLSRIALTVEECAPLVDADTSDQNGAIIELCRRYALACAKGTIGCKVDDGPHINCWIG
jgi:hypothetical protein